MASPSLRNPPQKVQRLWCCGLTCVPGYLIGVGFDDTPQPPQGERGEIFSSDVESHAKDAQRHPVASPASASPCAACQILRKQALLYRNAALLRFITILAGSVMREK